MSNNSKLPPVKLKFNNKIIECPINEGHPMFPVRTICKLIDVDFKRQDSWLKKHPFLSQLYNPTPTVGADNKVRTMNCLPFFGLISWLGAIGGRDRKQLSIDKQNFFLTWLYQQFSFLYKTKQEFEAENRYEIELMHKKEELLNKIESAQSEVGQLKKELRTVNGGIEEVRTNRWKGQLDLFDSPPLLK